VPQLQQHYTYASQVFWLAVCFAVLLIVMWRVALPRVAAILRDRQQRIQLDLEHAERLKAEAEAVIAAYEKAMADARNKAQALHRETHDALAKEAAARLAEIGQRLKIESDAAEARIQRARNEALAGVKTVATELAEAAVKRLIGIEVPRAEAEAAAQRAAQGR
jgi:F-type H+-transporting ATPase subunit b